MKFLHGLKKKGSNELRIVFDLAAKFMGRCLNDVLLSGPVWRNRLPFVFIGFQEEAIAFASDIKAMSSRSVLDQRTQPTIASYGLMKTGKWSPTRWID